MEKNAENTVEIEFARLSAQNSSQTASEKISSERKQNADGKGFSEILEEVAEKLKKASGEKTDSVKFDWEKFLLGKKSSSQNTDELKGGEGKSEEKAAIKKASRLVTELLSGDTEENHGKNNVTTLSVPSLTVQAGKNANFIDGDGKSGINGKVINGKVINGKGGNDTNGNGKAGGEKGVHNKTGAALSLSQQDAAGKGEVVFIRTAEAGRNEVKKQLMEASAEKKGTDEKASVARLLKRDKFSVIDGRNGKDGKGRLSEQLRESAGSIREKGDTTGGKESAGKNGTVKDGFEEQFMKFDRRDGMVTTKTWEIPTARANTQQSVTAHDQTALLKHLKSAGNGEIVKQATIILKNENSGEIRLMLKPEHLGNVRIRLNLQDNNIVGKIIVENINVKEAFEHNLESLHRAFRQEGFESTALDVSVGNQHKGEENREARPASGGTSKPEERFEENAPDRGDSVLQYEGNINLVV